MCNADVLQAKYNGADMTKQKDVEALINYTASEFKSVDILVNNAGMQSHIVSS